LIADASLAKEILAWQPERAALEDIIADAWVWEQKLCADLAG
jgi:UDP-glucose 4-epimerase